MTCCQANCGTCDYKSCGNRVESAARSAKAAYKCASLEEFLATRLHSEGESVATAKVKAGRAGYDPADVPDTLKRLLLKGRVKHEGTLWFRLA